MKNDCPNCGHQLNPWKLSLREDGHGRRNYECPKCAVRLTNRMHLGEVAIVATLLAVVFAFTAPRIVAGESVPDVWPLVALVVAVGVIIIGIAFFAVRDQLRFRTVQWED